MDESDTGAPPGKVRAGITRSFSRFEDAVYVGLALMLAYSAVALLVSGARELMQNLWQGAPVAGIVSLLDRALLILMIVELLYTVKVSFRSHVLVPEPFLVVGLIAATRRILVLTAEFAELVEKGEEPFRRAMIEVAILTAMVLALVGSLHLLRARSGTPDSSPTPVRDR